MIPTKPAGVLLQLIGAALLIPSVFYIVIYSLSLLNFWSAFMGIALLLWGGTAVRVPLTKTSA